MQVNNSFTYNTYFYYYIKFFPHWSKARGAPTCADGVG